MLYYKYHWLGYSLADEQWIHAEDISPEIYKSSGQKKVWKTSTKDIVATMHDHVDIKEAKNAPWSKTSEIELCTSLRKKKTSPPMLTPYLNRYLICSSNINAATVEPNWMIHIPSVCYICQSGITLEDEIANRVTIACYHLCTLVWMFGLDDLENWIVATSLLYCMHYAS